MNEERIYLTDYIEKFRTAYHQARAAFELYSNALESEKKNWQRELQRGWNDSESLKRDYAKHETTERELKGRLETVVREAKAEFAEIINEANGVFDRHFRATPESIDEKGLALLNSGVMTGKELLALADEYPENYTMRKLIGKKIEEVGVQTRDRDLEFKGRTLKLTPTTHSDALEAVQNWAEYALRPNEIERTAVFNRQFDQRIDEIKAKVEGYSIPKVAPAQNTGAINE
ncbi:MAG: hypothetical protein IKJ06_02085 [Clostridia bacterium]|nr:hypothetical protein [Clostridia bacterium]